MESIGLILIFIAVLAWSLMRRYDPATLGFFLSSAGQARSSKKQQDMANFSAFAQMLMQQNAEQAALGEMEAYRPMEEKSRVSMSDLLGYNGEDAAKAATDALMASPAVQLRLKEGAGMIDRSAAGKGSLKSGRTLMALQDRGQEIASGEYGAEFGRRKNMFDWGYENTKNRANIKGGKWQGFGETIGKQYSDLQDITKHKYDKFSQNSSEGMQMLSSMYGGGKKGGGGGGQQDLYGGDDYNSESAVRSRDYDWSDREAERNRSMYGSGVRQRRW